MLQHAPLAMKAALLFSCLFEAGSLLQSSDEGQLHFWFGACIDAATPSRPRLEDFTGHSEFLYRSVLRQPTQHTGGRSQTQMPVCEITRICIRTPEVDVYPCCSHRLMYRSTYTHVLHSICPTPRTASNTQARVSLASPEIFPTSGPQ